MPNFRGEEAETFAAENAGRFVRWVIADEEQWPGLDLLIVGTTTGSYIHIDSTNGQVRHAYALGEELTFVDGPVVGKHGAKWQRLGVTKGLEKLERTREEVLRAAT